MHSTRFSRAQAAVLAIGALLLVSQRAVAQSTSMAQNAMSQSNMAHTVLAKNLTNDGLAVKGYDAVAYFVAAQPTKGLTEFSVKHDGATYLFANSANRDAFMKNPERYVPQYGGYCAAGVAGNGKYDIDPDAWRVENNKLYLNKNKKTQEFWLRDVPGNIVKADKNWPTLGAIK